MVRLLDFVQQHDGVGLAAHLLGELSALLVADVARRRADESRDRVLLHILAHVDADDGVLRVEKVLGQHLGQVGLADAGGTEEDEGADGLVGVFQTGAVAADGLRDLHDRLVLTDDHALQLVGHAHQPLAFVLGDALYGHARHHCNHLRHRVFRHERTVLVHAVLPRLLDQLPLLVQLLDLVAVLGSLVVLLVADGLHLELLLLFDGGFGSKQLLRHMDVLDVETRSRLVHHIDSLVGQTAV